MLVMVMRQCSFNDDDDVTMTMMMMTNKGDQSLGNCVPTRCVWGGILDPRCYRCHFCRRVLIFCSCICRRFRPVVVWGNARASLICGSGDEEWCVAVMWRMAGTELLSVNSGRFTLVRAIQRPLPNDVTCAGSRGHLW